jgi:dipeptidyl aminopeptidase/acylaminoacyl peptidase
VKDAEQRTWEVIKRAYEERTPARPARSPGRRLVLALVVALGAVVAAVLSPPGRAVFHSVRVAVGIQHAEPALFSLPAHGRLLIVSAEHGGVWLVHDNGLKQRLGSYDDAQWSPHGRFAVVTRRNALIALDVDNGVRWSLARRDPTSPRWEGTQVDTRIAYLTPKGLRVVAGDGTGDHLLDRYAGDVPPAWDPARLHTVAYFAGGAIVLREADTGQLVWRAPIRITPAALEWSTDGRYLAVRSQQRVIVLDAAGHVHRTVSSLSNELTAMAFRPGTHLLAVSLRLQRRSEVRLVDVDHPGRARLLFAGPGVFGDIAWSPVGGTLLVAWPTADQWLFLHGSRVQAVANIEQQFPRADHVGPMLELAGRWCCS